MESSDTSVEGRNFGCDFWGWAWDLGCGNVPETGLDCRTVEGRLRCCGYYGVGVIGLGNVVEGIGLGNVAAVKDHG